MVGGRAAPTMALCAHCAHTVVPFLDPKCLNDPASDHVGIFSSAFIKGEKLTDETVEWSVHFLFVTSCVIFVFCCPDILCLVLLHPPLDCLPDPDVFVSSYLKY